MHRNVGKHHVRRWRVEICAAYGDSVSYLRMKRGKTTFQISLTLVMDDWIAKQAHAMVALVLSPQAGHVVALWKYPTILVL